MKVNLPAGRRARIEILPLIDIVFLLLVFFIYAMLSMAVHRGLAVALPSSSTAGVDRRSVISVTVKADGTVYLDKQPVAREELHAILRSRAKQSKEAGVLLFADRAVRYQELFRILDQIRMAGLQHISLQAEAESKR
jgi:biopolymer transport protein ExbD